MVRLSVVVGVLVGVCLLGVGVSTAAAQDETGAPQEGLNTTDLYASNDSDVPEQVRDVIATPDGGLIALVVGAGDEPGAFETTMLRLDERGTVQNAETVPGTFDSISRVDTDAYVAAGFRGNDSLLARISADGKVQWTEQYGGEESDIGTDVVSAPDGDAYLLSSSESVSETSELVVRRVDEDGTTRWEQVVDHESWVAFPEGERLRDGNLIVTVRTERSHDKSVDGKQNVSVARLSPDGEVQWRTVVVGTGEPLDKEEMFEVIPAHGDGVLIAGASNSGNTPGSYFEFWAAEVSTDGELQWQRQYDTPSRSFAQTAARSKNGYVIAGFISEDTDGGGPSSARLKAIGTDGTERYDVAFDRGERTRDVVAGIDWLADGRLVLGGSSAANTESGQTIRSWIVAVDRLPPDLEPGPSVWETQHSEAEKTDEVETSPPPSETTPPPPTETTTSQSTETAQSTVRETTDSDPATTPVAGGSGEDGPGFGVVSALVALVVCGVLLVGRKAF